MIEIPDGKGNTLVWNESHPFNEINIKRLDAALRVSGEVSEKLSDWSARVWNLNMDVNSLDSGETLAEEIAGRRGLFTQEEVNAVVRDFTRIHIALIALRMLGHDVNQPYPMTRRASVQQEIEQLRARLKELGAGGD